MRDDDDFTGEFLPEMQVFTSQFAGLPQGEIARIFSHKFRPMNLYKLLHMKGGDDVYREESISKMVRKAKSTYRDYDTDSLLWSEAFLNESVILFTLFGITNPSVYVQFPSRDYRSWPCLQ